MAPCTLSHEIEKYNGTTGQFVAWVKVPSINTGTVIYVYYGNSSVTSSQENKTDVWDSNYKLVQHQADNAANTTVTDSTSQNTGTSARNTSAMHTAGQIGSGFSFNGSSDGIAYSPVISVGTTGTIEGWIQTADKTLSYQNIFAQGSSIGLWLHVGKFSMYNSGNNDSNTQLANSTWYHFAIVQDGTGIYYYLNGTGDGSYGSGAFSFSADGTGKDSADGEYLSVVTRGMGKCCVAGAGDVDVDEKAREMRVKGQTFKAGDWISLDGTTGTRHQGQS